MVVPIKLVVACSVADDIFVITTIPAELPEDSEFTRLYYLRPEAEEVWHYCRKSLKQGNIRNEAL
jgi:hypothetical protein